MGPIIVIVGMLLMVVIHEAGHFIMAKVFDMKATEAFFGFGPRIWSTTRGETEYGVKAIPLGGYVRIVGMNPFEDVAPEEEHRTYRFKPFWQKSIVVLAGIVSHFVIAFILFYIVAVTWNTFEPSTEVNSVSNVLITASGAVNEQPLILESDDSVISVDGVPLADMATTTDKPPSALSTVVIDRGGTEITVVTTDNVVPTPAFLIGIQPGDRLVAIDGNQIRDWDHFVEMAHERPGQLAEIQVERDGDILNRLVQKSKFLKSAPSVLVQLDAGDRSSSLIGQQGKQTPVTVVKIAPKSAVGAHQNAEPLSLPHQGHRGTVEGVSISALF